MPCGKSQFDQWFLQITNITPHLLLYSSQANLTALRLQIPELTCTVDICTGGALVGVAGRGVIVFWGWDWACACACICAKACWGIISNCPFSLRTRTMPVKRETGQETNILFKYERTHFFSVCFYPSWMHMELMYCWRTTQMTNVVSNKSKPPSCIITFCLESFNYRNSPSLSNSFSVVCIRTQEFYVAQPKNSMSLEIAISNQAKCYLLFSKRFVSWSTANKR